LILHCIREGRALVTLDLDFGFCQPAPVQPGRLPWDSRPKTSR
jgi:hypothetical protein